MNDVKLKVIKKIKKCFENSTVNILINGYYKLCIVNTNKQLEILKIRLLHQVLNKYILCEFYKYSTQYDCNEMEILILSRYFCCVGCVIGTLDLLSI